MPLLCPTAVSALAAPAETTLRRLLTEYGLDMDAGLLASLTTLKDSLDHFSISCEPAIGLGDLDSSRVLSGKASDPVELVLKAIGEGEKPDVEFKSSLLLDVRRHRDAPGEPLNSYRLEAVTRSLLKTIAAFCNSGGGTIMVGVEDDGTICGLELDFSLADSGRNDFDGWDQVLRGLIERSFFDGRGVNNYVKAFPFLFDGKMFVRVQVANRTSLTFLKRPGGGCELYVRSGTRSIPIEFHDIEKYFDVKRTF